MENLLLGAVPNTIGGLSVITPFVSVSYQGWVGGIVSVDQNHVSRLRTLQSSSYYFIVLILQLLPYSLTIGAGMKLGIDTYRENLAKKIKEYRIDKRALLDVGIIYLAAIPLFFAASCFEFLSEWNV